MSSEILYLLDSAQGLFMPEGNTSRRDNGKLREGTRSRAPIRATHSLLDRAAVIKATREPLKFLGEP